MGKLTQKQIADAKALLKANGEKELWVIPNGHMYSHKSNALISVGGDESQLEYVSIDDSKEPTKPMKVAADEGNDGGKDENDLTPDPSWKLTELQDYCKEKGIALDGTEKSKKDVLAKIEAAEAAK